MHYTVPPPPSLRPISSSPPNHCLQVTICYHPLRHSHTPNMSISPLPPYQPIQPPPIPSLLTSKCPRLSIATLPYSRYEYLYACLCLLLSYRLRITLHWVASIDIVQYGKYTPKGMCEKKGRRGEEVKM